MMNEQDAEDCRSHLRLALGFSETVTVNADSSECAVRNALSRCYYALFHASRAWLLTKAISLGASKDHGWLQKLIGKHRGRTFRERLADLYRLREDSDYRPQMFSGSLYEGDIQKFRVIALRDLALGRTEIDWYVKEIRQSLTL